MISGIDVNSIVSALDQRGCAPYRDGDGWRAKCPCHNGNTTNSLAISDDGKIHCFGCNVGIGDVLRELGLVDKSASYSPKPKVTIDGKSVTLHDSEQSAIEAAQWSVCQKAGIAERPPDRLHRYHDKDGNHVLTIVIWKFSPTHKEPRQIRPHDGGWICKSMKANRPLYHLPEVMAESSVVVCEGEKTADALRSIGLNATTPSQGAMSPAKTDWSVLSEKSVTITVDNDDAGREFGKLVIDLLPKDVVSVKVVELKDDWPELPAKGDAADWVEQFADVEHAALCNRFKSLPDHFETINAIVPKKKRRERMLARPVATDGQEPQEPGDRSYDCTDLNDIGNAQHYATKYENDLRFCAAWGKWLVWDNTRWKIDDEGRPIKLAKELVHTMFNDALELRGGEVFKHVCETAKASRLRAMIDLAGPELPIRVEELDQDGWILNCKNGVVDLKTGTLNPHDRTKGITKLCPTAFHPDSDSPEWNQFLLDVFDDDVDLIQFVQRLFGHFLTGDVSEQKLALFYGTGANGKSTLLNAFMDTIGPDYTMQCMPDFLMEKKGESHPTEKASLFGKRFVSCVETEASRRLAESTVKMLTGGEKIMARRMREDFWEFNPTHKLVLCTNHRPIVSGTDHGIWRRLLLVPFLQRFDGDRQDKQLPEKLKAERSGILAWAVRGCLEWQRIGLNPPASITGATEDYRSSEDIFGRFIADCCVVNRAGAVPFKNLYARFEQWANDGGDFLPAKRVVGAWLDENGYEKYSANGRHYRGLMLRETSEAEDIEDPFLKS